MTWESALSSAFWSKLTVMHGHFLWQGIVIAWLYWTIVKLFAIRSAQARYAMSMMSLLVMVGCLVVTFRLAETESPPPLTEQTHVEVETQPVQQISIVPEWSSNAVMETGWLEDESEFEAEVIPKAVVRADLENASASEEPASAGSFAPILIGVWLAGVVVLALRLMGGMATILWYRWSARGVSDVRCQELLEHLSRRMGRRRSPRLTVSDQIADAMTFGLFRPVIVLPASWVLRLSPSTLESVLAHELAHIRRFDAWAVLFQRIVETVLFYHPAVWWLSKQADREREKCCDLQAVSATGDRLEYVKSLAGIAALQRALRLANGSGPILATGMGGRKMHLLERVRHVLGETPRSGATSRFLAGALVLAIPAALWLGTTIYPAAADEGELIAQADREREGGEQREREGDRERGERERGDRPRGDREREGDRPRGDREREGVRPIRRDGERREGAGFRRDGDRPDGARREGDRRPPGFPPRAREGEGSRDRGPFPPGVRGFRREGGPPREGEGDRPPGFNREGVAPQVEMMRLIRELRQEVEQLRREVRELRGERGEGGERREIERREIIERREGGFRPERDRPRGFDREREEVERDRPRREGDGFRPERDRPRETDRPREERREGGKALERPTEERREGAERIERERERVRDTEEVEVVLEFEVDAGIPARAEEK